MYDLLKAFTVAAAVACAAPVFAQTATDDTTTEAQETAPTQRADGLATGTELRQVGETYILSEHGDWDLRCIRAPEGQKDVCQLYQLLEDQNGNSVAEINMFNLPDDDELAAGATIVTPLETLLTAQVTLSVDGGTAKIYPFTFCTPIGCFSRVGFTDGDVAAFKAGNEAQIFIVPVQAPDQRVRLTVSLTGFTAGFDAVQEVNQPSE